ncbi:hypothetical protein A2955_02195 [Candidatus Woesebacteria bacterium RIFCSPLOWO2_01_FULL_37_19]|uniref:Endonuclease/exonuclease/phosphatase domain-containing protein n=2 Tax=Candidatus Woeseibacteriota TaxID=1752722 RepID=A0A1F8B6Z6_9BACT|nr:MAG: hypothetical protein A2771_00635 [Candidatus Woesebacteria bacterium RIFCSPHIGHO2_01_FULL_38_26b]OGM59777.1 MAG: hypothetical protein A2955_02195 [Candidatus Woesebacteria bacterium RIFCSPLOWO2_01_FULL_37_19]
MKLKILSWNIWIDGDFDGITSFIKQSKADVIGLQEVKDNDPERKIINYLQKLGYEYVFAPVLKIWGGKEYKDGPAVFSKYPIKNDKKYILTENESRAVAQADIQIKYKLLHVFSTHLSHTHQKPSEIQDEQARNLIKLIPEKNSILMGDFNALPESNTIKIVERYMTNVDEKNQPTWSVYEKGCETCRIKEIIHRLDYIFISKNLQAENYNVESSRASDHLPISVTVEL